MTGDDSLKRINNKRETRGTTMTITLLIIIYLAFIILGLPDSRLGTAWPFMQQELGAPLETAGVISMIISVGTILSSLISGRLLKRYGTGNVTFVSVLMTRSEERRVGKECRCEGARYR